MSYLSLVTSAHKISSGEVPEGGKFAEEFLVLVHGYLHPIRLPSSHILGLFKLEVEVVPQDDILFLPQNRQ